MPKTIPEAVQEARVLVADALAVRMRDAAIAAVEAQDWRADRLTFRDVCNVLDCDTDILRAAIYRKLPADSLAVIWRAKW